MSLSGVSLRFFTKVERRVFIRRKNHGEDNTTLVIAFMVIWSGSLYLQMC